MLHQFLTFQLHPIFWYCISYILGISSKTPKILGYQQLALIAILLIFFKSYKSIYRFFLNSTLILFFFILGIYTYNKTIQDYYDLKQPLLNKNFNCCAVVNNIENKKTKHFNYCLTLLTKYIEYGVSPLDNKNIKLKKIIKIYINQKTDLKLGDIILINNLKISKNKNEIFEQYLIKEDILDIKFEKKLHYTLLNNCSDDFFEKINSLQKTVANNLIGKMSKTTGTLFSSIFLGNKSNNFNNLESLKEKFNYWGIFHYLARSGLHVILIILIWSILLSFIPCPFIIKQIIMTLMLLVYTILTWSSISYLRAFITFLLYKICIIKNLPIHCIHILTLTCFLILLHNPLHLFYLDFQLSFCLTFALAWYNETQLRISRDCA